MIRQTEHSYEFDSFRVDPVKRLLWRDGAVVGLTPKAFDLLLALIESGGEVVEKDKLMARVWHDSFVEEGNLTYNIHTLRKALGEKPHQHNFIITVPGIGYKFVAEVREVEAGSADLIVKEKVTARVIIEDETDGRDTAVTNYEMASIAPAHVPAKPV